MKPAVSILMLLFATLTAFAQSDRPYVVIHRQGESNCHTFRIPAITITNDGTLLAVYDMRYRSRRDLQGHMDIGLSRSTDGGETWEPPRPIMDMGAYGGLPEDQNGCSDPNILVDKTTGEIFVSAVWTHGRPGTHQWRDKGSEPGLELSQSSQFLVVRSKDDGKTWSSPENWTAKLKNPAWYLFAPAPGNGITLTDGTLVMPSQGRDHTGAPFSNLMWSKDHGQTWTVSNQARTDTSECAVAQLSDGSLMINIRDNRNRADKSETNGRAVSVTNDLGKSWTVHPSDHGSLPEPVCMASLISHRLKDGRTVLFFSNPNHKSKRKNMTVQMSLDDGKTWPKKIVLDEKGGAYSSLVVVDDQTLGILYESSRADFVFQKIQFNEFGL
jgi:sialidase-1